MNLPYTTYLVTLPYAGGGTVYTSVDARDELDAAKKAFVTRGRIEDFPPGEKAEILVYKLENPTAFKVGYNISFKEVS